MPRLTGARENFSSSFRTPLLIKHMGATRDNACSSDSYKLFQRPLLRAGPLRALGPAQRNVTHSQTHRRHSRLLSICILSQWTGCFAVLMSKTAFALESGVSCNGIWDSDWQCPPPRPRHTHRPAALGSQKIPAWTEIPVAPYSTLRLP